MRIRVNPAGLIAYAAVSLILKTFADLAGPLSAFIAVLLPALAFSSIAHLILSWRFFTFHQSFSTDHPLKGETVRYELHMVNEGPIPLACGDCGFSRPGPTALIASHVRTPAGIKEAFTHREEIHCPWRGTYEIGLTEIRFRDALSIVEIAEYTEPRIFYVYPELVSLSPSVASLARSSGSDTAGTGTLDCDASIFEYLAPLRVGSAPRRLAWKRWAATGIPAEVVTGQSRSSALRLVLDLRSCSPLRAQKLQAEDLAMSAVFSVLLEFVRQEIPVELILGGEEQGVMVDTMETFHQLFEASTNILFSDYRFPLAAFVPGTATLLVTTMPIVESGDDIFTLYEQALGKSCEPHLLACPPPASADEVHRAMNSLSERQQASGRHGLLTHSGGGSWAQGARACASYLGQSVPSYWIL
ncbi:hypothetical protein MASR2M78_21630 [Treponema sp.]